MPRGISFGDHKTYRLRKYYEAWIERTLLTASNTVSNPRDRLRILHFKDNIKPMEILDLGRIPCGDLQQSGRMSRFDDKVACLLVIVRNIVETWWQCSKNLPGHVEPLLVELDDLLETFTSVVVCGIPERGYTIRLYDDN
ncbi:hypothetical protein LCGC14_2488780 [marine sediment metagenome]|uniref:Uncharacterized protein n=1 Tax=marine sediment metagenome TaxID=412755 RepID=A0A0F9DZ54_9ZZZZ